MKTKEEIKQIIGTAPTVSQMTSRKGNKIPNQYEIYISGGLLFQSYNSPIAFKLEGITYLFKDWDYSKTTGKYRNLFLNETKQETLKKLKSGEYVAVDFEVC
jgi:hypothetical protein